MERFRQDRKFDDYKVKIIFRHMNSLKQIAENITSDIMNNQPIANILLKAKIFATKKQDYDFLHWVNQELNGYDGNLPDYRKLKSGIKLDIHRGWQIVSNFPYPTEYIKDKDIRERLEVFPIVVPISEVEELSKSNSDSIHMEIPAGLWERHIGYCITGTIQRAYQHTNVSGINNIIVAVKDIIVEYMLKYSENEDINFASIIECKRNEIVMNKTTYNAAIVNTGSGNINATNTSNIVGNENTINAQTKEGLEEIMSKIKELLPSDDSELKEIVIEIESEMSQSIPKKSVIKRGLQAMKGLAQGITAGVIANKLPGLISSALALL